LAGVHDVRLVATEKKYGSVLRSKGFGKAAISFLFFLLVKYIFFPLPFSSIFGQFMSREIHVTMVQLKTCLTF